MSSSREGTPDWLSTFKTPTYSAIMLSTDSDSSRDDKPLEKDIINKEEPSSACETSPFLKNNDHDMIVGNVEESASRKNSKSEMKRKRLKAEDDDLAKKKKTKAHGKNKNIRGNSIDVDVKVEENTGHIKRHVSNSSAWTLSSDSESCPDDIPIKEVLSHHERASKCETSQSPVKREDEDAFLTSSNVKPLRNADSVVKKSSEDFPAMKPSRRNTQKNKKGDDVKLEAEEEAASRKHIEPQASSSRMPLILAEKVNYSKALVECEGESIDLSGDVGSVGRVIISDTPFGSHDLFLDLKGTIYKTTIVPSRTFCVVSLAQSEAKIEAVMNDFIQLKPQSNVYEAETIVEGTLEGFSFESDDENEKKNKAGVGQTDKEGNGEGQANTTPDGKAEKTQRKKKAKTGGAAKGAKKVQRRGRVSKKGKTKK